MTTDNVLAPLLVEASKTLKAYNSPNAIVCSTVLLNAAQQPIVKPPHTVIQCQQLHYAYAQSNTPLNKLVENLEQHLHWGDTGSGVKPKAVQERLAFVELIGPTGMLKNSVCRIGLFFQSRATDYPAHCHAAEELYLVISGRALWSKETAPLPHKKLPGEFIEHASWEPHAMKTTQQAMLALWCWTGNIEFDQYRMV